jgi:hypothetical protein
MLIPKVDGSGTWTWRRSLWETAWWGRLVDSLRARGGLNNLVIKRTPRQ